MPSRSALLISVILLCVGHVRAEKKFCPEGTAVIADQPGCESCLCCRYAETNEYLVRCDHEDLNMAPIIPVNTTELWLYGNNISRIQAFQHLPSLRKLKLSDCRTSESLRWRGDCMEKAVVLSDQALINLPSLQYLEVYINSHDQLQFLHHGINISQLVIACETHLPSVVQNRFYKFNTRKIVSFDCGINLAKANNVAVMEIKDDSSMTNTIDLPNTELELSVHRADSSECLNFTRLRVQSLRLICKCRVLNITKHMFGNLTEVGKLNLTIEATSPGYLNTTRVSPIRIDSLYFNLHFYDPFFIKCVTYVLLDVHIENFGLKLSSRDRFQTNYYYATVSQMFNKWPALQRFISETPKILTDDIKGEKMREALAKIFRDIYAYAETGYAESAKFQQALNNDFWSRPKKLSSELYENVAKRLSRSKRSIFKHWMNKIKHKTKQIRTKVKDSVKKVGKGLGKGIETTVRNSAKKVRQYVIKNKMKEFVNKVGHEIEKGIEAHGQDWMELWGRNAVELIKNIGSGIDDYWGPYLSTIPASKLRSYECYSCELSVSLDNTHKMASLRRLIIKSDVNSKVQLTLGKWLNKAQRLETLILTSVEYLDISFDLNIEHENLIHLDLSNARAVETARITNTEFDKLPNLRLLKLDKSFRNVSMCSAQPGKDLAKDHVCFSFSGLWKLEVLSYSDNDAQFLGSLPDILNGLVKLKELYLGGNQLNKLPANGLKTLLYPVADTLSILDLSQNKITVMPSDTFSHFRRLRRLNLNGNLLQVVSVDLLKDSTLLSHIDMGSNQLTTIEPELVTAKPFLRVFNVSSNTFHCDCSLRNFRDWVNEHSNSIKMDASKERCYNPEVSLFMDVLLTVYSTAWIACDNHWIIVECLIVIASLALVAGLTYMIYYYRYDIVYLWFLRKRRAQNYVTLTNSDDEFDAFLSYCRNDTRIALNIHDRLEDDEDARFRVAIHDRDFTPGWYINENIAHYVKHSRKFIPLISRSFLQSEWALYELEMAKYRSFEEKRNMLIPVFIEDIPRSELPDSLKALVRRVTYLQWPVNAQQREREVFFKRLKMNLGWDRPKRDEMMTSV